MRIIIADDHALFRGGLKLQLSELEGAVAIEEVGDFTALFEAAEKTDPDLIVADLGMPGPAWRDAIVLIRERQPRCRLVVISANDTADTVREAIKLGANGFISKADAPEVLIAALNLILCGGTYVPINFIQESTSGAPVAVADSAITKRQLDVLQLLALGLSNKEIAWRLKLTEGTVKLHVAAVLRSMGATNRTQAVTTAQRSGLLPA